MSSDDVSMTPGGLHKPPIKVESKDLSSSKMVSGLGIEKVGGSFGVLPLQSMKEYSMPIVSPTPYEGTFNSLLISIIGNILFCLQVILLIPSISKS